MMDADAAIVMPKLGLTMTEGLLASWRIAAGDEVRRGDVLFVVETEKVANEVVAESDGRIRALLVGEGETAPVGAAVATWVAASPGSPSPAAARARGARIVATPFARKQAKSHGLDLAAVAGSGPGGRVKGADVAAAIARAAPGAAGKATLDVRGDAAPGRGASARPANAIERTIARRLTESKRTIPHFYVLAAADVGSLDEFRARMNRDQARPRLTITHFLVAALARALADIPDGNRVWRDEEIVALGAIDIGLAVEAERGLAAPVLRDADRLGLTGIAAAVADLARKARAGALAADDVEGGAIAISNVGMYGASHIVPIINPGQSAILGVGAVRPTFRPDAAGAPKLCRELGLVLSCDHRVWDGAGAARFLDRVTRLLENPLLLLR
jgi:pyruvate dehydrogenase E2 component (dihydrolipoamide acetyltransferase)